VTRPPAHRLVALLTILLLAFAGVVARLAMLQVRQAGTLTALGAEQRTRPRELPATRGQILDRNGSPLAMTLDAQDIYADPSHVVDPAREAAAMAPVLGMKTRAVQALLSRDGTFVYVARQVDADLADQLAAMNLPGIGFLPVQKRYYPSGALASQVVGFVGVDGDGLTGLERQWDETLAGTPGEQTVEVSAQGQAIAGAERVLRAPVPGDDVVLTIDRELQFRAQQYLAQTVKANKAKGGTIIVMDPVTGEIYAMASYPWFDPNRFTEFASTSFANRAVTDTWEPGSVNKIITAAAALQTRRVSPTERFRVAATRDVSGYTIHDAERHAVESMTLGDIIAHSSNVGISMVADRVGSEALASVFGRFGFGRPTGVRFPGEAAGLMPPGGAWSDLTRATVSFGSGVAVTPLQMASVYATIANGGTWVQPRLVEGIRGDDGTLRRDASSPTRRVVRPDTAQLLTRMLAYVVADGTGSNAQIAGYQVAGKTGTAKKLDGRGRYTDRYVASFIGFLPASRPRVVVAAVIDEPRTIYGGVAAAPLFQDVARFAIQRLGIEPAPAVDLPPHAIPLP
jgi:cell division protein FtsI (penicillin-binding protein 3)